MRNPLRESISDWPTQGYLHGAIDILERLHYGKGDRWTVPPECQVSHWRFPGFLYTRISHWTIGNQHRLAVLGFGQEPAVTMLGWILELAGLRNRILTSLDLGERDWPILMFACGRLARCRIIIEPGKPNDADALYELIQCLAADHKVTRFLVSDLCLNHGTLLSKLPIPSHWRTMSQMLGTKLLIFMHQSMRGEAEPVNPARAGRPRM